MDGMYSWTHPFAGIIHSQNIGTDCLSGKELRALKWYSSLSESTREGGSGSQSF
jgi:hypothetical protein